jgi:hypothetical protein
VALTAARPVSRGLDCCEASVAWSWSVVRPVSRGLDCYEASVA